MLRNEAIRLASRQEQSHDLIEPNHHAVAPTHDRRHAHAQALPQDADHYIRAVRQFAGFLGRSPDTASVEDLRGFQLHLVDHGISPSSLNATITGLKFFFEITLGQARVDGEDAAGACPAHAAGGVEPRGGGAPDRRGEEPEAPDGALGGLRRRTARERSGGAEGGRRRQRAHDAAHRAGQGPQGSLRHALAGAAGASARLVARGPRPGQDARWRVAVSRPESDRAR